MPQHPPHSPRQAAIQARKKYFAGSIFFRTFAAGNRVISLNQLIINLKCSTKPFSF